MNPLLQRMTRLYSPRAARLPFRWRAGAALALGAAALLSGPAPASAQDDDVLDPIDERRQLVQTVIAREDVSGGGAFHYVIFRQPTQEEASEEDWTLERNVVARGQMGFEGISRVILAPQTDYFMSALYADSLMFGSTTFTTPRAGETFEIPSMGFYDLEDPDSDGDGLSDIREFVVGTDDQNPDSDGDEVLDAAEVQQGSDPLDGFVAATGIIATSSMPGEAVDVVAANNLAVVAARAAGVALFNVESGRNPTRIGQVDTPGDATMVALFDRFVAVADNAAGLTVLNIADPPAANVRFTMRPGQNVTAVATFGSVAFAGGSGGLIVSADMVSGSEIARNQTLNGRIWDLAVRGDYLYALRTGSLSVFRIEDGDLEFVRSVTAQGSVGAGQRPLRIAFGEDQLFATFTSGFNVFSLADPANPQLQTRHATAQQGWKQIAFNGSGQAVAAVSPNSTNDGPHHISLYSVGENNTDLEFVTEFETPGLAASVTIFNGRAFVADSAEGLQVINYLAFDRFGVAPEVELETNAVDGEFEEGKLMDVRALVADDVQARNVQFYVDGRLISIDGNYPFGFRVATPLITPETDSFELYAVATDTGGNMTTSETLVIDLVPDNTPPRIKSTIPKNAAFVGSLDGVVAVASEPLDTETLTPDTFVVAEAGADELFGTPDDVVLPGALSFDETTNRIGWDGGGELDEGAYQVSILPPLADLAGNPLEAPHIFNFKVLGFVDSDGDGLPDFWELENGLDPENPDSNGNGTPDGQEDGDFDNLPNIGEFLLDRDPGNFDTDGDGVRDGDGDEDLDGLTDGEEFQFGADPFKLDTDGDGITDSDEIREGTNPLSPNSLPDSLVASDPASYLNALPLEPAPFENLFTVASDSASYLNALPLVPADELQFSAASLPASYLNASELPADLDTLLGFSPEVSYEAQSE